ncbi:MAG: hypothetical protein JOZ49_09860 [Mycolicibacterium sp.]|nr:hypothetical protein [Mycolicibacterium sp.]
MQSRKWVPDPAVIADQLIEDYRKADSEELGDLDVLHTLGSWLYTARDHGEQFTEDDWLALVQELARRCGRI